MLAWQAHMPHRGPHAPEIDYHPWRLTQSTSERAKAQQPEDTGPQDSSWEGERWKAQL